MRKNNVKPKMGKFLVSATWVEYLHVQRYKGTNLTSLAWASVTLLSGASVCLISVTCSAKQQKVIMLYFYMHNIKSFQLRITPIRNKQRCAAPQKRFKIVVQLICSRFAVFHKLFCSQSKVAAGCKNAVQPFKVLHSILQLSGSPPIAVK